MDVSSTRWARHLLLGTLEIGLTVVVFSWGTCKKSLKITKSDSVRMILIMYKSGETESFT